MPFVSVKSDYREALRKLGPEAVEKVKTAAMRTINKVANTGRGAASSAIRDEGYGLKAGDLKKAISVKTASPQYLNATIRAQGRPLPLISYGARQTSKGVSVNVLNGRKTIQGAFLATMKSGHRGVFVRVDSAAGRKYGGRNAKGAGIKRRAGRSSNRHGLPIDELFGPSIPSAFRKEDVLTAVEAKIRERFPIVWAQEIKYVGLGK